MEDLFFYNIDKYVYEECTAEEIKQFQAHMENCEKCRAEYELSCSVKNAMSAMNNITPPADFSKLINERLDAELAASKKKRILMPGYRKYSAVAACLVLAAVLGVKELNTSEPVVIEKSTVTDSGLQAVSGNEYVPPSQLEAPIVEPEPTLSTESASERDASTFDSPVAIPAATQLPAPVQTSSPAPSAQNDDVLSRIPAHLDPREHVVLASSVEKTYEISGITPEDLPKKERDLAAEFSLLETPKSGIIVANAATISTMEGVQFIISSSDSTPKDYGIGSGSIFISSKDKSQVDELVQKYISAEDSDCYFFTNDNFNSFIEELNNSGISYQKHLISNDGNNVAFKLIVS